MADDRTKLKAKITFKLEKYAEGITQEEIDAGRAKPLETIFIEEEEEEQENAVN